VHVYAQPRAPDFLSAQESVARDHPWFAVRRLEAVSHFPTLEELDETADRTVASLRRHRGPPT
jgi:hypothetical protein